MRCEIVVVSASARRDQAAEGRVGPARSVVAEHHRLVRHHREEDGDRAREDGPTVALRRVRAGAVVVPAARKSLGTLDSPSSWNQRLRTQLRRRDALDPLRRLRTPLRF